MTGLCLGTMTRKRRSARMVLAVLCLLALPAQAQQWELSPFVGWRFGGDFDDADTDADYDIDDAASYGLIFSWTLDHQRQFEVLWSYQPTEIDSGGQFGGEPVLDLDIHYLHIGGIYAPGASKRWRPFVSGGVGLTHLDPDRSGLDTETDISLSVGVGLKAFFTEHVGVRLEARGYVTILDSDTRLFCSGGCDVRVEGSGFQQGEVFVGLIAAF
jgi:opacity protein-like surface antigen